jgi:DNA polymerase sigma
MSKSKADFAESSFNKFLVIHGIDREHGYVQRILEILDNVGPTTQDVQKKTQFVKHIQPIIIKHFKDKFDVDCEPVVVGSFTTGFDVEGSDLDMTIILPEPVTKDVNIQMIDSLKEELEKDEAVFRKFFVCCSCISNA